jgi:hypothetical protein
MTEIEKNGIVKLSKFFNEHEVDSFLVEFNDIIQSEKVYDVESNPHTDFNRLRAENKFVINKRMKSRDGDEGMIDLWNYDHKMSDATKSLLNRINTHAINMLREAYPDAGYELKTHNVYINKSVTETRGIHADSDFFPSRIKSFVYLTDVPDNSYGPFSYIKTSHVKSGLAYHRKYDIIEPLNDEDKKNYEIYTGIKKGDVVIAAVSGGHRGLPQTQGKLRIAIVSSYDPNN